MSLPIDSARYTSEPYTAPRPVKVLFWLLLGVTSVILAEVVSFSAPLAFFDVWGVLVVFPLYTLHALVLSWIVFRPNRPTINALFLAGVIFGMYEAYITKVVWQPTWGEMTWIAGGIYLVQSAILVLFWHPIMAFVLPLMVVEGLFTTSHETLDSLPQRLRRMLCGRAAPLVVAIFALYCGLYQGMNSPSAGASLLSGIASGLVFGALALLWQWVTRRQAYTLRALLPSRRQAIFLGILLLFNYLWQGILIRPEALPRTPGPHLTVLGMYLALGVLLYLNIKHAPALSQTYGIETTTSLTLSNETCSARRISWKLALLFWIVFSLTSAFATSVKPAACLVVLLSWVFGIGIGLLILVRSAVAPGHVGDGHG